MKKVYKTFMIMLFILLSIFLININEVYADDNEENIKVKIVKVKIYDSKTKKTREAKAINNIECNVGDKITITANVDTGVWHVFSLLRAEFTADSKVMDGKKYIPDWPYKDNEFEVEAKNGGIGWIKITAVKTEKLENGEYKCVTKTLTVSVTDVEKEIGKQNELITAGKEYNTYIQDAYKTIPSENANAEEIRDFVSSDVTYNNKANLNSDKISIELLKKWQDTIYAKSAKEYDADKKRYDLVSAYLLNCRLKKEGKQNSIDSLESSIKNSTETAVDANNKTIESAQKKLATIISGPKDASRTETVFTNDVLDDPSAYNPTDPSSEDDSEAATIIDKILSLITTVGTVVSILMLAILGVKYMLGSVEEKAEYKKDLVPYFIGAALLFGICAIVKILQSLGSTINNL